MSEKLFQFEVVTPNRILVNQEVEYVVAPGGEGEFGVLLGHCPFITTLKIGGLMYRQGGAEHYMTVMGGFAEVTPSKMTVLAELAEMAEDLDLERARRAQEDAEDKLSSALTESEKDPIRKRLERSLTRQQIAEKIQK